MFVCSFSIPLKDCQFIFLDFKITFLTKNTDHNGISQEGSHLFSVGVEQIKTAIKMGGQTSRSR